MFPNAIDAAASMFDQLKQRISGGINQLGSGIQNVASDIGQGVQNVSSGIRNAVDPDYIQQASRSWNIPIEPSYDQYVKPAVDAFTNAVSQKVAGVSNFLQQTSQQVGDLGNAYYQGVVKPSMPIVNQYLGNLGNQALQTGQELAKLTPPYQVASQINPQLPKANPLSAFTDVLGTAWQANPIAPALGAGFGFVKGLRESGGNLNQASQQAISGINEQPFIGQALTSNPNLAQGINIASLPLMMLHGGIKNTSVISALDKNAIIPNELAKDTGRVLREYEMNGQFSPDALDSLRNLLVNTTKKISNKEFMGASEDQLYSAAKNLLTQNQDYAHRQLPYYNSLLGTQGEQALTPERIKELAPDLTSQEGQGIVSRILAKANKVKPQFDDIFNQIAQKVGLKPNEDFESRVKDDDTFTKKVAQHRLEGTENYDEKGVNDAYGGRFIVDTPAQKTQIIRAMNQLDRDGQLDILKQQQVDKDPYHAFHIDFKKNGVNGEIQIHNPNSVLESVVNHEIRAQAGENPPPALQQEKQINAQVAQQMPPEAAQQLARGIEKARKEGKPPPGGGEEQFVRNEPFNLKMGANEKETAGNIRSEEVGIRNAQIVKGNNLRDVLQKQITPQEDRAIAWYRSAGGDTNKLQQWANDADSKLDPYRQDIKNAMTLSPNAQRVSGILDQYYSQAGQRALKMGSINDIRENYENRIYKPEPPKEYIPTEGKGALQTSTGHARQRYYDTLYDAVKGGKEIAATSSTDAMAIHNEEMAHVNTARQMAGEMKNSGIGGWYNPGELPQGWKQVGTLKNTLPFTDNKGKARIASQVFAAPEGIAKGLGALADPNFAKRIDEVRAISQYQGLVKTVDLSFSLFHHLTLAAQTLYQSRGGIDFLRDGGRILQNMKGAAIDGMEEDFARNGGMTTKIQANQDILRDLIGQKNDFYSKFTNFPGVKQTLQLAQKNANFLFGTVQRYMKVMDYGNKVAAWVGAHPQAGDGELVAAKQGFAKEINAAFGGLNWEQMGVSKSALTGLRGLILAPDWTLSNVALAKYAFEGGTAGASARSHILTAIVGGLLATEALNKTLTGHFSNENPKGHELEVQIAPNVYVSMFRGGIGDMLKFGSMVSESGLQGASRFAQGKLSPFARTGIEALSGVDYAGRSIYKGKDVLAKTISGAGNLAASALPIPLGMSSLIKYGTSPEPTALGAGAVATGIGRYSVPSTKAPAVYGTAEAQKGQEATNQIIQQVIKSNDITPLQKEQLDSAVATLKQQKKDILANQGVFFGLGKPSDEQKNQQIDSINKQIKTIGDLQKGSKKDLQFPQITGDKALDNLSVAGFIQNVGQKIKDTQALYQDGVISADTANGKIIQYQKLQQQAKLYLLDTKYQATGNPTIDRLLMRQYATQVGSQINNVVSQVQSGQLPADQGGAMIQELQAKMQGLRAMTATGGGPNINNLTPRMGMNQLNVPAAPNLQLKPIVARGGSMKGMTSIPAIKLPQGAQPLHIRAGAGGAVHLPKVTEPKIRAAKVTSFKMPRLTTVRLRSRRYAGRVQI